MTYQEIDKWVEEHVIFTNPNATPENKRIAMDATKLIARRFYNIGKEEGKKVVDYTAAFDLEDQMRWLCNSQPTK